MAFTYLNIEKIISFKKNILVVLSVEIFFSAFLHIKHGSNTWCFQFPDTFIECSRSGSLFRI